MGFVIAHELLHSRQWQERTLAEAVLCTMGYMHWSRSHLVHHQRVTNTPLSWYNVSFIFQRVVNNDCRYDMMAPLPKPALPGFDKALENEGAAPAGTLRLAGPGPGQCH